MERDEVLAMAGLLEGGRKLGLGRGRAAQPALVLGVRELTVEELAHASMTPEGSGTPALKSLRQSHHQLARVLAQSLTDTEASAITGYSPSRISILKRDPSFLELLEYYKAMEAEQSKTARADMHERLASLGFDAVEVLHEKLVDDPDSFDPKTLLAIVEATADRTGHGKTATVQHNHDHSVSDATLEAIKRNANTPAQVSEADRRAVLGLATRLTAPDYSDAQEVDWEPSSGSSLREEGGEGSEEAPGGADGVSPLDRISRC